MKNSGFRIALQIVRHGTILPTGGQSTTRSKSTLRLTRRGIITLVSLPLAILAVVSAVLPSLFDFGYPLATSLAAVALMFASGYTVNKAINRRKSRVLI